MLSLPVEGYRIRPKPSTVRLILVVFCGAPLLLDVLIVLSWLKSGHPDTWSSVFGAAMTGLLLFLAVKVARTEVTLRNDGFEVRSIAVRNYPLSDFAGYRVISTGSQYGTVQRYKLEGTLDHRDVTLVNGSPDLFNPGDIRVLREWLTEHFPDLEARDRAGEARERDEAKIEGRHLPSRATARRIARLLNWTVFVVAAVCYLSLNWGLIHTPFMAKVVSLVGLALVPLTLGLKIWSPTSFQLASLVGPGAPPSIDLGIVLGSLLAIAVGWSVGQPVRWSEVLLPVAAVLLVLCAVTFKFGFARRDRAPATVTLIAVLLSLYSLGATLVLNAALDSRRPNIQDGLVTERSTSSGRGGRTYYWTIRFPNERGLERKISVPRRFYDMYNIRPQDPPVPVPVLIGPGALGIKWIRGFPI